MKIDGYRYVREYHVRDKVRGRRVEPGRRWALWERVNGKARRVGTAFNEEMYKAFLAGTYHGQHPANNDERD